MKKLLVAIDFSPASKAAFDYAAWLSIQLDAELTAIHVAHPIRTTETLAPAIVAKMESKEDAKLLAQLREFTTFYPALGAEELTASPRATCLVKRGNPSTEIIRTATNEAVDTIVIGTKAKHTIWQQVFGSLTTALITDSPKSLLIVPENNEIEEVKNIAFASAINLEEEAIMPNLFDFAEKVGAGVHPFYINAAKEERFKLKEELLDPGWSQEDAPSSVTMIREKSIVDGIAYFLEKYPCEILALYVPRRAFFEQIFHRSLSKQVAYSTRIPLLVCKQPVDQDRQRN